MPHVVVVVIVDSRLRVAITPNKHKTKSFPSNLSSILVESRFVEDGKAALKKYTEEVIEALDKDLTDEQKNRIKAMAEKPFDSVKNDTKLLFNLIGSMVERFMSIPDNVSIEEDNLEPNSIEVAVEEAEVRNRLAELEKTYVQQQIMIEALMKENEHYDEVLLPQAEVDMQLCDFFEHLVGDDGHMDEQVLASAMSLLGEENTRTRTDRMRRSLH